MARDVAFGSIEKSPGSTEVIGLDFFPWVADFWESGKQYTASDIVRPRSVTGFAYQAGADGQSNPTEPAWPSTLSGTVVDGGITWTAIAADTNGVTAVTSPSATVTPSGELTASSASVVDGMGGNTQVNITLAGGAAGKTYRVQVTVTAGSETLVGSLYVTVKIS